MAYKVSIIKNTFQACPPCLLRSAGVGLSFPIPHVVSPMKFVIKLEVFLALFAMALLTFFWVPTFGNTTKAVPCFTTNFYFIPNIIR